MKIDVQLEFPAEQAAVALEWLQSLPDGLVAHFEGRRKREAVATPATEELSEAEQHALLDQVFGSWQQEEGEEDLLSQIYGGRHDAPREVNL
ncbi:hypothetical protein [Hymenobacter baengnokdamensis]|uniref:hypothetical protein n=1 Tax=Hymenobacter baengnokdamensis TaxID=2615203 RepID=UPI00124603B8|nr:hypothetical protein [Hymenobacter baengnokdamensis]